MGIFKKALHSKIDVFVKFESAINLEIRGQIKKKLNSFYLGHRDHMYAFSSKSGTEPFRALGDLTWNDPVAISRDQPLVPFFVGATSVASCDHADLLLAIF